MVHKNQNLQFPPKSQQFNIPKYFTVKKRHNNPDKVFIEHIINYPRKSMLYIENVLPPHTHQIHILKPNP